MSATKYTRFGKDIVELITDDDGKVSKKKIYGGGKDDTINGAKRMSRKLQMEEQGDRLGGPNCILRVA